MLYAGIVPDIKIKTEIETFSYRVPENLEKIIQPGQVASIPFRKRKVLGVIWKLYPTPPEKIAHILEIEKLLDQEPVFNELHRQILEEVAKYYFSPLSEIVFDFLPRRFLDHLTPASPLAGEKKFSFRLFIGPLEKRLEFYKEIIKKNFPKFETLLLFPTLDLSNRAMEKLKEDFPPYRIALYTRETSPKSLAILFQGIRSGAYPIVVGTRSAVMLPLANLKTIILDQPEDFAFKDEREPGVETEKVARIRAQKENLELVLGDLTLSLKEFIWSKRLPEKTTVVSSLAEKVIFMRRGKEFFSPFLKEKIEKVLERGGKVLFFLNRRGETGWLTCQSCREVFFKKRNQTLPSVCPRCQSHHFAFQGIGLERVLEETEKNFPQIKGRGATKITKVEGPSTSLRVKDIQRSQVVVATQKIFDFEGSFDLAVAFSLDSFLNLPDFNQAEKIYRIIQNLRMIAKEVYLETNFPENYPFNFASQKDGFFRQELSLRRKALYPPYTRLLKIILRGKEEKIEKDSKAIYETLKKTFPHLLVSLPHSPFIEKLRGGFRRQILIKITKDTETEKLKQTLRELKEDFRLEVDPQSLL